MLCPRMHDVEAASESAAAESNVLIVPIWKSQRHVAAQSLDGMDTVIG